MGVGRGRVSGGGGTERDVGVWRGRVSGDVGMRGMWG